MARPPCTAAAGLACGYLADVFLGDPERGHPVAGFGRVAQRVETAMWADSRARGVAYTAVCTVLGCTAGAVLERIAARGAVSHVAVTALATWSVLGTRGLASEGERMALLLDAGDLPAARARLAHLCGRDAGDLDAAALARASCESIAENTSDAVVAPLLWGAVAGVPGLCGYRALNTLDAMVGHRSPRYTRFGWAAARADDAANLVPARVSASLAALAAPLVGGSPVASLRCWWTDGHRHPSPNAGRVEAAFAGALGVRLGGTNSYGGDVQDRGTLGGGRAPSQRDLRSAVRLSKALGWFTLAGSAGLACAVRGASRRVRSERASRP